MRLLPLLVAALLMAGCGKVPESGAAKKIGEQPKQVVDKAAADVGKALQQGADARREADEKK